MTFTIRPARLEDAEQITQVHIQTWQETYRGMMPDEFLDNIDAKKRIAWHQNNIGQSGYMLAEESGRILGFIMYGQTRDSSDPTQGEIWGINLINEAKGRGIGEVLMRRAATELIKNGFQEISLWVVKENESACRFYEVLGGTPDGHSKDVEIGGKNVSELRYVWKNPQAARLINPKKTFPGQAPKP